MPRSLLGQVPKRITWRGPFTKAFPLLRTGASTERPETFLPKAEAIAEGVLVCGEDRPAALDWLADHGHAAPAPRAMSATWLCRVIADVEVARYGRPAEAVMFARKSSGEVRCLLGGAVRTLEVR